MKIKITEMEASAEELRQSKSLSEAFTEALRKAFIPPTPTPIVVKTVEEDEDED